jgi:hypothetical protein
VSLTVRLGKSILCPDCPRSLPNTHVEVCFVALPNPSREGLAAPKGSALARLVVELRDQERMGVRWYDTARNDTRPQVYGRSADDR